MSRHGNIRLRVAGGFLVHLLCFSGAASAQQAPLQITAPANGTIVNPGQTISVTVTGASGTSVAQVAVIGEMPIGISPVQTSPPYQFSVVIPASIKPGMYALTAFGVSVSNQELASDPITIDVERTDTPVSLSAAPTQVQLESQGEEIPLQILGTFSDGSVVNVTESSNMSYTSSAPSVATVGTTGIVTGAAAGSATITATFGTGSSAPHITVAVTVLPPVVTPAPTALTFGNQNVGTVSGAQTVTLTNSSSAPLSILGVSSPGDFSETDNCVSQSPLAAAGICSISVTFAPTMSGMRVGALSITNNAVMAATVVTLQGDGVGTPSASLSMTSLTFQGQLVGTNSSVQQVTLNNSGTAALNISGISLSGANAGDFAQSNNCGASVAVEANCTINVSFTPTATGTRTATVAITDDAANSPQTVSLSGTGTASSVNLSTASLSFSSQVVGTTGTAQTVTVSNEGTASLSITSIAVTGTNGSDFAETNNCGTSVAAGANCTISATFTPTSTGTRNASVTITDNASNSPQTIAVSGTGTDFSFAAASGGSTSATATAGQTATYNLQLSPSSGFTGSVSLSCSGAPSEAACSVSPSTVNVTGNSAMPFSVSVATTARSLVPLSYRRIENPRRLLELLSILLAVFVVLLFSVKGDRLKKNRATVVVATVAVALFLTTCGCGGNNNTSGGNPGTPPGTYTVMVNGNAQGATRSLNLTLTVQ